MEALLMTLGSGWVSGVRPYFMVFLLGLSGRILGLEQVPDVLQRTDLLVITGILLRRSAPMPPSRPPGPR